MIEKIDQRFIRFSQKIALPLARLAIFIVYFWFGILKVVGQSPASPLVEQLFQKTISFMNFETFLTLFGLFEMLVGTLFLIKGMERSALVLLAIHMITTVMPLFVLPVATWSGLFVPTLEGQYIIKNILIIASAIFIASKLTQNTVK